MGLFHCQRCRHPIQAEASLLAAHESLVPDRVLPSAALGYYSYEMFKILVGVD